jgi:hypothetical protein
MQVENSLDHTTFSSFCLPGSSHKVIWQTRLEINASADGFVKTLHQI